MTSIGTEGHPLRVAVVGSGPAGFYVAEHLLNRDGVLAEVDMFERLPTPYGLVRFGVAPDHEKIKNVTRTFDKKTASNPRFRFFGNVEVGKDVTLDDLRQHYHQICFASGAQTDRRMGIPGEDLEGSHPATDFVAWYNGHPDYRDYEFDLSAERVAVVGVGNVAVDVARILCRTTEELATTDIADHALEALRQSSVKEVVMLGRRGPAQAAFTNPEVRELGQMEGADIHVLEDEVTLDPLTQAEVESSQDRNTNKKLEILQSFTKAERSGKPKLLTLRFLASPVELVGADGQVTAIRVVKNELYRTDDGSLRPRATEEVEEFPVGLVFRSVGYHGVAIPGLPFDERRGVVPNDAGRVMDTESQSAVPGVYVSGWIKRGPTGVIGTNKPDAAETVATMASDVASGGVLSPENDGAEAALRLVEQRQPDFVSYADWVRLNEIESERGKAQGRPRVKFTSIDEALAALRDTKA